MKYPDCAICKAVRKILPKNEVPDSIIDAFHDKRGGGCMKIIPEKYRNLVRETIINMPERK